MTIQTYPRLGETVAEHTLENGLHVFVFPKPDFEKNFAFFATNYGGMDTKIGSETEETPQGVAHFLEHKMFDTKEGNALQALSQNGASPNAFTSSALTGYYFEGSEKFEDNLKILLSFVSTAYFTQESVDKEQGIIGQEIRMIEDNPDWQVFMNLMAALYQVHPIRNSVAGSQESIAKITAKTLDACHAQFYHPANMVLCVAGNVDPKRVCMLAREILPQVKKAPITRHYAESGVCAREKSEIKMDVATPVFQFGVKLEPKGMYQELMGDLVCDAWLGSSTPLYAKLYAEGLINGSFSYGCEVYPGCAFLVIGGESRDPDAVCAAICAEATRIAQEGLDEALFERLKKAAYGNRVRALNSFEHLCVQQAQGYFSNINPWRFPEFYDEIQKTDIEFFLQDCVYPEVTAVSVVSPREAEQ
ncbi:MAG: pitrilysin family protein [Evtepia sp.]